MPGNLFTLLNQQSGECCLIVSEISMDKPNMALLRYLKYMIKIYTPHMKFNEKEKEKEAKNNDDEDLERFLRGGFGAK